MRTDGPAELWGECRTPIQIVRQVRDKLEATNHCSDLYDSIQNKELQGRILPSYIN